jgi:hypothetical protein
VDLPLSAPGAPAGAPSSGHDHFIEGLLDSNSGWAAQANVGGSRAARRPKWPRSRRRTAVVLAVLTVAGLVIVGSQMFALRRSPSPEETVLDFTEAMHEHRFSDAWLLLCRDHQDTYDFSLREFEESSSRPEAGTQRTFVVTGKARHDFVDRGWYVPARSEPGGHAGPFFRGAYKVCFPREA